MSALNTLQQNNGLKTTQSVLNKQQSGVDAAQKANPQETAAQMNMNTAQAMLHNKEQQLTPPKDAHEQAVRTNQQTAEGMLHNEIPIVKKDEPQKEQPKQEEKKQLTYADMYKILNPENSETSAQREKNEKRERRNMRIAAFGDGLRALSNIVFSTKGAKVVHNPDADMTKTMLKRKQMIDAQREKNKAAWLTGYQRALALDEEARKNNLTLAEQMRYHDMIADNNKEKNDLSQQRINLSRYRLDNLNDYNDRKLQIDKDYKDGLLSEKSKSNAIAQLNAEANMLRAQKSGSGKGGSSSSTSNRKGNYSGNVEEYITLKQNDPKGMAEAEAEARKMGYSPKTASGKAAARVLYQKKHGKTNQTVKPAKKGGGNKGGSSASNGGKKKTGVKW